MLICNNCGKTIREEDLSTHNDFISYYGDDRYYETSADNCSCGGEFEEAIQCDSCDEYCLNADITLGWRHNVCVCKNCIESYKGKYSKIYNQLVVNGVDEFIDWLVDKNEISEK